MRLSEWQYSLQHAVLTGAPDCLAGCRQAPAATAPLAAHTGLGVYQQAYPLRLEEALRTNYPMLHQLLGDVDFAQLNRVLLAIYPPRDASIRWYGRELAQCLSETAPYAQVPIFMELAAFEWALRHTVDAADAMPLTLPELMTIAPSEWGALRFTLAPSLSTLEFAWNTLPVWRALNDGATPPNPELGLQHWLVWRGADMHSEWRSASAVEVWALECLRAGESFAELCEGLLPWYPDTAPEAVALHAAAFLRAWIEQGLLSLATPVAAHLTHPS